MTDQNNPRPKCPNCRTRTRVVRDGGIASFYRCTGCGYVTFFRPGKRAMTTVISAWCKPGLRRFIRLGKIRGNPIAWWPVKSLQAWKGIMTVISPKVVRGRLVWTRLDHGVYDETFKPAGPATYATYAEALNPAEGHMPLDIDTEKRIGRIRVIPLSKSE